MLLDVVSVDSLQEHKHFSIGFSYLSFEKHILETHAAAAENPMQTQAVTVGTGAVVGYSTLDATGIRTYLRDERDAAKLGRSAYARATSCLCHLHTDIIR